MPVIKNVSPYGALDVPLLGRTVEANEEIEVSEAQAAILLAQAENYQEVKARKASDK